MQNAKTVEGTPCLVLQNITNMITEKKVTKCASHSLDTHQNQSWLLPHLNLIVCR